MTSTHQNARFCVKTDGFHGELFYPVRDEYPGKALISFGGSDGNFELAEQLATVFQGRGLTTLALAYVKEEGLPDGFYRVPIDTLEAAARRLHDMGYAKVGLWGISKGAELSLLAGSLLPGLVNAVVAVAPMSTACQGFTKNRGIVIAPGSSWSFHGEEVPYSSFGLEKFPPCPCAGKEPPGAGGDYGRPVRAAGRASQPGGGHPGRGHHRPHPPDFLQDGHHVALRAGGGGHHEAPERESICLSLPAFELCARKPPVRSHGGQAGKMLPG